MAEIDVVRAWKSDSYRGAQTEDKLADLPDNPAGISELNEAELMNVGGGGTPAAAAIHSWFALLRRLLRPSLVGLGINAGF
ncbi:mersacidin/lichenicidin family type 2 lantibiotic [Corynebacterium sp. TAE3-ERU12]|uniref:mersacidin/lichenicidin family type 2 lantibiotic n=1 Tax=Corynebacterium sp. TAE3-ERU12 TaxID=2849491 RepID=UPI001C43D759|nr:mersacidin/lichenicidin family type 2 lantibiotic [Corynebacterium sp. TAE3-ERU12]MBV7295645.1 mersacidin/lichenicidin family type 2 lantibiotic [Corynebacterium sp. TAE3-ERU12]